VFVCADKEKAIQRGEELIHLQQKCKLTNLQTMHVKEAMEKAGVEKINLTDARKKVIADAGVQCIILHGCVGSNDGTLCSHVFKPEDKRSNCPKCGHSRYGSDGTTPNEQVYWFPIGPRLEQLLKLDSFQQLLQACT